MTRALVLFSGGVASWAAAKRTVAAGYDTWRQLQLSLDGWRR